ncbi:MAG: helix-turn-helix domain-containing protein [Chloroflexota bacterium]|nr:helix-turn-helix domain-containing protein [Chloroflexota bacterium]
MPSARRSQHQPTDDWQQLRLLVNSPEQETYELLRPIVLFGRSSVARARETGVPERTLRRKAARFGSAGMRSLFAPDDLPESDRRRLPLGIRKAIVELKAECPALRPYEIATICRHRFGRAVGHHTVERVLATEPLPLHPPRRFPRYRDIPDPVARRKAIVDLYEEGWTVTRIAECLVTSRSRVYDTLQRWVAEDLAGLADRSRAPHRHARKVDLKAMVAIRRLQANPELGEFRIHAALEQLGIHLSPRTCGRILALHRDLGAPRPAASAPHAPQPMPFAAQRRHQYWTVDVRYVEDHQLGTGKPVYVISVLENFSRALLASAITPRQDLTAYLIVLRAAVEIHGAPEALVSDGGTIFRAAQATAIYGVLGIRKERIDPGQAWQSYIETHFDVMRRMADYHLARATNWEELRGAHARFVHDYNHQAHTAHTDRPKGRRSPAAVLGWVHGAWCDAADLDRLFRLRATRVLNAGGSVRFRHWRLYGERGLAGERAAVWLDGATLTVEYATEALAQYRVTYESDGRLLREVDEPRLFPTRYPSPQPFLPPLDEVEWHPVQRLAPYRLRRANSGEGRQTPLFDPDRLATSG